MNMLSNNDDQDVNLVNNASVRVQSTYFEKLRLAHTFLLCKNIKTGRSDLSHSSLRKEPLVFRSNHCKEIIEGKNSDKVGTPLNVSKQTRRWPSGQPVDLG